MRGKTCGGCNLRLQYKCGKLCNCCYKRENLRWLQYTDAGNYVTAVMRGKTCGGYNTNVVNYATAAMHGKACGAVQVQEIMQLVLCAAKTVTVASAGVRS